MKDNRFSLLYLLVVFVFTLYACEDGVSPGCETSGEVMQSVENVEGRIWLDPDTGERIIRYSVPGTIDSVWAGIVCNEAFPDFLITKETRVRFSGHFRDDKGQIENLPRLAGEEYFYLELTFIEEIN